jgi:hypothetical protein
VQKLNEIEWKQYFKDEELVDPYDIDVNALD